MPLYKYLTEEAHARALVEKGEVFLRTISHFRAIESERVRGDPDDAKLRYEPVGGLKLTKENGEVIEMPPGSFFRSSVRADDIFVYCLSRDLSEALAAEFESTFCVEIKNPIHLLGRIKSHVKLRAALDHKHVYSAAVEYRKFDVAPIVDWALPERIAFIKPEGWARQVEHRIVVGKRGAFDVENVDCAIENAGSQIEGSRAATDPLVLRVGDLSKISEIHRF